MHDTAASRPGFWSTWGGLLRDGWQSVRTGGSRLLAIMLAFHVVALLIAFPLFGWLFREALRATGMVAVDFSALHLGGGTTITVALIVVICALAFWLASLQFATLVLVLRRSARGETPTLREIGRDIASVARKLVRPSSFPLVVYLFVILPLTGFGFTSVFAEGIAIPSFITGELEKSAVSAAVLYAFLLLLAFLNIRFALTLPIFALTDATGGRAMRASWRVTRGWAIVPLLLAVVAVLIIAAVVTIALVIAAIVPTAVADETAPGSAPVIAAFSLGAAQVLGAILTAVVTSLIGALLIAFLTRYQERLPGALAVRDPEQVGATHRFSTRAVAGTVAGACAIAALGLGALNIDTMHRLSEQPDTFVLGHRGFSGGGFSDGGVENTLSGLDAAKAAGADFVEMDVMQSKDGKFIAMHDANLLRLADVNAAVKDLTFDELVGTPVHDIAGNEDVIPSFADYVAHADAIGMPLLIEIKLGGGDTEDHVELLIEELEGLDTLTNHIYHSLDAASVARLKQLRPDLTVGYTMAFAGAGVPETPADFIVVEEWSATQEMQNDARQAGLGFMAWTVNDTAGMRELLRRNVDGIITDHPDLAVQTRAEMQDESGLADTLLDALTSFVVVF